MKAHFINFKAILALTVSVLLSIFSQSFAATYYWDTNSNTAGSSAGTTADGTWSFEGSTWSTSFTGNAVTSAYTTLSTDDLIFSAGMNATGASAIGLTTTQDAKSLTFEEGTFTISGAGGVINLGGAGGNITVNSGASAIIGNNTNTVIGGSVGLTKLGAGTLTLNGTATNTFTGGINVNGGTLALDYANIAASTDLVSSQALNFGGGNLTLKGKTGGNTTTQSFGNVTVNSGGGSLLIDPNNGTSTTLTLGSLTATAAGGSLAVGKALSAGTGTVAITTTTDKDATGIYGGRIVFASGTANTGYDWATNTGGAGPYTLSAYSGYSALDLTVGSDTLNSRITASQTLGGARVTNSLKIENPAATQALALGSNLLTLTSGGLLVTGTNAVSITGTAGATRLTAGNGSGAYDLVVHQYNSGGLTISAVIGNNGGNATTLTKAGTGTLTLSGLNTFTGGLVVNGGQVTAGVTQGFTGGITISNGGSLRWDVAIGTNTFGNNTNALIFKGSGGSTSVAGSGGTNHTYTSGQVDAGAVASLGSAGLGSSGTTYTFTNGVSGGGELIMAGGGSNQANQVGTFNLNNSSTFTGIIKFQRGTNTAANIINFSALGDGGKISQNSGGDRVGLTVNYTGAAATGATFNTRQLEIDGGAATFNAGITINSNGSGALIFNTDLSVTANATSGKNLTLGGTSTGFNNQFNGLISNGTSPNAIGLAKTGASTWVVSNTSNSYTGGTSLTGGTLQFTKTAAMPATGLVAVGTGTTLAVNAGAASGEWTNATSGNGSIGGLLAGLGGQVGSTVSWTGAVGLGIDTTNATAGTMTYSGVIANVGTSLGITKLGTGILVLDQANTFNGATTVSNGTLKLNNNLALQNSALTFSAASQLDLTDRTALQLGGLNSSVNLASVTGYNTTVNSLTLNTATGVTATYSGILSNGAATNLPLTKTGAGTQTLSNASNSFSGNIIINNGNLTFSNTGSWGGASKNVTFTGAATVTSSATGYSGGIIDTGGFTATVGGSGLTFASAIGAGTLIYFPSVGSQTLNINNASALTGNLRVNTGGTTNAHPAVQFSSLSDTVGSKIQFGGTNSDSNQQATARYVGTAPLVFDNRVIEILAPPSSNGPRYNKVDSSSASAANTWTINTTLSMLSTQSRELELTGTNTGNNAFNGQIGNGSGTIKLNKTGAGIWNVTNSSNNYSGGTAVSAGTLGFVSGALGSAGAINASGGTLLWLPGNTQDISSRLAMTAATASTFNTYNKDVTFASAIGSSTTGQLVKTGLGTLTLQGTNTFTGTTTLGGGGKLTLDYSTNDTTKLSDTANLVLDGGSLVLKGGTHAETVLSASLSANNWGTFISRESSSSTKINLNAITVTGTQSVLSFSENNIATTDRLNVNGIMGAWFTVGNSWAANSTGAADGNVVAYTGATAFASATSSTGDTNFNLTNGASLSGGIATNTLRIISTLDDQVLNLGGNTLTVSNFTGTNALAGTSGGLLYAGGANGNYTITGTSAARLTPENGNGQALLINVYSGTLNLDVILSNSGSTLNKAGEGTLVMKKDNTGFTAATRVYQGALRLTTANATGTNAGGIFVQNGAALELSGGLTFVDDALTITGEGIASGGALKNLSGANTYQGAITIGNGGARISNADTGNALTVRGITTAQFADVTFGGAGNITHSTTAISGAGNLIKDGAGILTSSAANTYTGATHINAGILNVSSTGNINSTAAINVAAGATVRYNSSTALTVAPSLAGNGASNRAVLGGAGTIGVAVTLDNVGDVLSPGNSPGIQTYTTAQTWSSFTYDWEVNDFTGLTAGTAFDQLNLTTLDLTGGTGSYVLNVLGLTADNASGLVPNFSEISRSWTILTTSGGISNFDAANWAINTTGFTDPHTGNWSLAQTGNDLVLSYTVIPEPKAALLGGIGLLLLLRRRR
jgi:autotransporter-associated beta strand protein